jgi:chromosome segregation protein
LNEAYALVGREALDYHALEVVEDGKTLSESELAILPRQAQEERKRQIEKGKVRLEDAGVGNGADVLKEFKETEERDLYLAKELLDLEKAAESLTLLIADLDQRLTTEFKEGIHKINSQFQEFFALMFGGGTASLEVIREKKRKRKDVGLAALEGDEAVALAIEEAEAAEEEGHEGVEIQVTLPRKKIRGLEMLSGGERALTSIALLFAISQVNPPPFIILDETDAALDEANSRKYGDMIENLSKLSQLILITHNRETMSRAGVLYGVTMGAEGASKLLSIQFDQAVLVAK